ncbi:transposase [Cerasicoccus maritimus]|uniref:transposase n=1 Tax=Cerasicoccus maritimus TaxID=490089 RepID=UPI0028528C59|nr:transposase [Cerasicoccus maritimus]
MPNHRLQKELNYLRGSGGGQLQSLFGEEITLPPGDGYRRVFDRSTTFWTFLNQVLLGGSCRDATREVQAYRESDGQRPISSANSAYCQARARLPLSWIEQQGGRVAQQLQLSSRWDWRGRRVLLADATSCQLADTSLNQAAYPQPGSQQPGCGHPVMQLLGVFDLGSGALLSWEKSPWNVGEASLFETAVMPQAEAGDVQVGDRAYESYRCHALLKMRGAESVIRLHQRRKCPLRANQREAIGWLALLGPLVMRRFQSVCCLVGF